MLGSMWGNLNLPISIHALHEESDHVTGGNTRFIIVISIHALHEESDDRKTKSPKTARISIHALHEESD